MVVGNLHADISDGHGFFSGTVEDLSRFGLRLDDVSIRLNDKSKHFSVIVSGLGKHFKMKARPRWASGKSYSKKVGLEIVNAPLGWTEFVMEHEPGTDDTWAEITI